MELSPVQLIESDLVKVLVEYNVRGKDDIDESDGTDDGTNILLEHMKSIRRSENIQDESNGNKKRAISYFVMLGLRSGDNQSDDQPYNFEIIIGGHIQVAVNGRPLDQVDDMAAKYGFTMLYSQIRETLLNISARMRHGAYILPTMSFLNSTYPKDEVPAKK